MTNRLYGNLIFELSKEGRKGYSLAITRYLHPCVVQRMLSCLSVTS